MLLLRSDNRSARFMIKPGSAISDLSTRLRVGLALMSREDTPDDGRTDRGGGGAGQGATGVATKLRTRTKRPSMYRVLLLNDDYTPMEFVVMILQEVFHRSKDDATRIMLHVHQKGVGECGVYPYEVAESKVTQVMDAARKNQHPLQCVMEKK
jgi:ATP-dependent Clp protease adaptor protein ClpS